MRDNDVIKQKYSEMSDAELLRLFKDEREGLTTDAVKILEQEINKRKILFAKEEESTTNEYQRISIFDLRANLIHFITDSKEQNKNNDFIIEGLKERGLDENDAACIMNQIPDYALHIVQKSAQHILYGFTFLIAGLSITFLPLSHETHKAMYVLAYALTAFGSIRLIHGLNNKRRFSRMMNKK